MWTGRQTLGSIERSIAELHGEEGQLDQTLRSAMGEAERLRRERAEAFKELARVKLDEISAGRLAGNLDAGERRASQILEDYRLRLAGVAQRREALLKEVAGAEADRHTAAAAVEEALDAVEALRAAAEVDVQSAPEWQTAMKALDEAEAIAAEAEKKAASSEAELGAKRKPYDEDPLFIYLWRRGYGTSHYRAGNIARLLDRSVAEFVGYGDARPNYAALTEIPFRLREHATTKRAEGDERRATLAEIEHQAMVAAGVDDKERVLAQTRHALAAADDMLEKKRALLHNIDEERAGLVAGGTDPAYDEALATVAAADSKDDLATLYEEARRTPTAADEAIVRRLEALGPGLAKVDAEIASLRKSAQDLARRRLEVERVRDRFRGAGYDHPHTTFGNDMDIADVLKRIAVGAVRSGVLWDILRQGYGTRAPRGRPDFGAPSFPFPFPIPGGGTVGSPGGGWREPASRGGWNPRIDFPWADGGRREGDDDDDDDDRGRFRTGGSF